jgi:FixJ family two-component response regulator
MILKDPPQPDACIHVVDDNEGVRTSIELLVRTLGYPSQAYPCAEAFLDNFEPCNGHCLILDLQLPGMTGVDLQLELRARDISIAVIAMTGGAPRELIQRSTQAGALAVLAKPFRLDRLEPLIRLALHC